MPRTCPICKRALPPEADTAAFRPFCSPRCKTIDLGGWLTETYRISSPIDEEDLDEGTPAAVPVEAGAQRRRTN